MKQSRCSEEQIIRILKEAESGIPVTGLYRRYGMSDTDFYARHRKYRGPEVSEAKRLRLPEAENRKLKKLPVR